MRFYKWNVQHSLTELRGLNTTLLYLSKNPKAYGERKESIDKCTRTIVQRNILHQKPMFGLIQILFGTYDLCTPTLFEGRGNNFCCIYSESVIAINIMFSAIACKIDKGELRAKLVSMSLLLLSFALLINYVITLLKISANFI